MNFSERQQGSFKYLSWLPLHSPFSASSSFSRDSEIEERTLTLFGTRQFQECWLLAAVCGFFVLSLLLFIVLTLFLFIYLLSLFYHVVKLIMLLSYQIQIKLSLYKHPGKHQFIFFLLLICWTTWREKNNCRKHSVCVLLVLTYFSMPVKETTEWLIPLLWLKKWVSPFVWFFITCWRLHQKYN